MYSVSNCATDKADVQDEQMSELGRLEKEVYTQSGVEQNWSVAEHSFTVFKEGDGLCITSFLMMYR